VSVLFDFGFENSSTVDDLVRFYLETGEFSSVARLLQKTGSDHWRWSLVTSMTLGRNPLVKRIRDEQFESNLAKYFRK